MAPRSAERSSTCWQTWAVSSPRPPHRQPRTAGREWPGRRRSQKQRRGIAPNCLPPLPRLRVPTHASPVRTVAACRRLPASTATPTRKDSCHRRPPPTCATRASTTCPTATGLDRNEVGALLVAAGLASARDHALVSVLAINGLRVSEALGANIEALGIERGHRTLTVARKGGKIVIIPLASRPARAIDLAIGERVEGPIVLATSGDRLDRPFRLLTCPFASTEPATIHTNVRYEHMFALAGGG